MSEEIKKDETKSKESVDILVPEIKEKKPSFFGNLIKTVIVGDAKEVGKQIVTNVVVPRLKNTICEIIDQGARGLVYGDPTMGKGGSTNRTAYNSIFEGPAKSSNSVKVVPISQASSYTHNSSSQGVDTIGYNIIWYPTKEQAFSVLQQMRMELAHTGYVTVAKYYSYSSRGELVNSNYTTNYYGWRNLDDAYPYENANGMWRIAFPYQPIRVSALNK